MTGQSEATRIASVAHMFLSDLRDPGDGGDTPVRKKPVSHSHPPPPQQTDQPFGADPSIFSADEPAIAGVKPLHVMAVAASHLRWDGAKGLARLARHLASPNKAVAVVKLESTAVHVRLFYHKALAGQFSKIIFNRDGDSSEYAEASPTPSDAWSAGGGHDPDRMWAALEQISPDIDYLLICSDPTADDRFNETILNRVHTICVLVHPQQDHLVASYQTIKSIGAGRPGTPVGMFVTQAGDREQASLIFERLQQTAREFADTNLVDFGFDLAEQAVAQELLCRTDLGQDRGKRLACMQQLEQFLTELTSASGQPPASPDRREPPAEKRSVPDTGERSVPPTNTRDALIAMDLDGVNGDLTDRLADELLGGTGTRNDRFTEFLINCGLKCAAARVDDTDALILLIRDNDDVQTAGWALANYPKTAQTLYLVAAVPVDSTLQRAWSKPFAQVKIIPALEGQLDGQRRMVLQRP